MAMAEPGDYEVTATPPAVPGAAAAAGWNSWEGMSGGKRMGLFALCL